MKNDNTIKKRTAPKKLYSNSKINFLSKILLKKEPYPIIETVMTRYEDKKIIKFINI